MLALVAVWSTNSFAQSNGAVSGVVKDSNGGRVAGATITVTGISQAVSQTVQSSAIGDFNFPLLPPGTYTLTTEMAGFKKNNRSNVVVPVSTKVSVGDITLEIGSLSDTIAAVVISGAMTA